MQRRKDDKLNAPHVANSTIVMSTEKTKRKKSLEELKIHILDTYLLDHKLYYS